MDSASLFIVHYISKLKRLEHATGYWLTYINFKLTNDWTCNLNRDKRFIIAHAIIEGFVEDTTLYGNMDDQAVAISIGAHFIQQSSLFQ